MPRADGRRTRRGNTDDRNRAELSVAESEARHRALLSALPEGVVLLDPTGEVLLANPRAHVLLGLDAKSIWVDDNEPPSAPSTDVAPEVGPVGAGSPAALPPEASSPGAASPGAASPEAASPTAASPAAFSPDVPGRPEPSVIPAPRRAEPTHPSGTTSPTPLALLDAAAAQAFSTRTTQRDVPLTVTHGGRTRTLSVTSVPLLSDDGSPLAVVSVLGEAPARATAPPTTSAPTTSAPTTSAPTTERRPVPTTAASPSVAAPATAPTSVVTVAAPASPAPASTPAPPPPTAAPAPDPRPGDDLFRQSMRHSPVGVAVAALNGRLLRVNRTLCRMLGYRADELQQRRFYELLHEADLEETSLQVGYLLRGDQDAVSLERRFVGNGGMTLWGRLSVTSVRDDDGRPLQLIVQVEDLSEIHRAQQLLTHMTLHDPLTGLANRALMLDQVQKALDRSRRHDRKVAVLQCDIDHFKVINDSAGHDDGDAVLVEVGRRVSRALRPGESAGRAGGDEFVVVCPAVADEQEAVAIAERVRRSVAAPLALGDQTLHPTMSVGIALAADADVDPVSLLRDADIATYRAKDRGRDRWDLVDGALRRSALGRLETEHALRAAIGAGELQLHFQPIVDLGNREVVGREALVRWNHPERGLLGPVNFLGVAEESGLIVQIGEWVLGEAARAAAASPGAAGYVAINVSPNQVAHPGLADSVEKALAETGLPASRLVIELTESVMLSSAPGARDEIQRLDDLGVRIVVDDFGTGFSPLSYLRDLPVSGIKVDRSFTAGLGNDAHCERIVEALTGLGQGLGVDVIVEGVETEAQREMLAAIGTEHAQGYLFGRPTPAYA